jgi:hypothetical protein
MESTVSGGIQYKYNGYDQVCNYLLEEYKKCATIDNKSFIRRNSCDGSERCSQEKLPNPTLLHRDALVPMLVPRIVPSSGIASYPNTHTTDCSNKLYLIEKICMPGKRKRNI